MSTGEFLEYQNKARHVHGKLQFSLFNGGSSAVRQDRPVSQPNHHDQHRQICTTMRVDSWKFTLDVVVVSLVKRLTNTRNSQAEQLSGRRTPGDGHDDNSKHCNATNRSICVCRRHHQRAVWPRRRRKRRRRRRNQEDDDEQEEEAINPTKSIILVAIVALSPDRHPPPTTRWPVLLLLLLHLLTRSSSITPADRSGCRRRTWDRPGQEAGACVANRQRTDVARFMTFCCCCSSSDALHDHGPSDWTEDDEWRANNATDFGEETQTITTHRWRRIPGHSRNFHIQQDVVDVEEDSVITNRLSIDRAAYRLLHQDSIHSLG